MIEPEICLLLGLAKFASDHNCYAMQFEESTTNYTLIKKILKQRECVSCTASAILVLQHSRLSLISETRHTKEINKNSNQKDK